MPCNDKPTNCGPCQDCGTAPEPIVPRCQDVNLVPGVYSNAVVTVNSNGCISAVVSGEPDPYTPDPCCAPVGGGGGGSPGLPGPPGPAGAAATIDVGTVSTGAPGTAVQVVNTGTTAAAIFNFTIPRGDPGADGSSGSGADLNGPGLVFEDGLFQGTTPVWPPVFTVLAESMPDGIELSASKNPTTGELSLAIDATAYDAAIRAEFQGQIDALELQLANMQIVITGLTTRINGHDTEIEDITTRLDICCPAP